MRNVRGLARLFVTVLTNRTVLVILFIVLIFLVFTLVIVKFGGCEFARWSVVNACGVGFLYHVSTSVEVPYFTYSVNKSASTCVIYVTYSGSFTIRDYSAVTCNVRGRTMIEIGNSIVMLSNRTCIVLTCPSSQSCTFTCMGVLCTISIKPLTVPVTWSINATSTS